MRPSNNPGNTTLSDAYWRVQLACINQAHSSLSSLKPPLEYNQDQTLLMNQHLHTAEYKRYNRFTIVENTICNSPRSWQPSFLEVMDSFVLVTYTSLVASKTLLQQLLTCLNFTLDSEDLFCWYKWKNWFLWTMASAQEAERHVNEWGLTWFLQWGIYASV